jgi:glycosyltransferase involved in cell wall biosynthesis
MKIGIIARSGQLGYSIRTNAFFNALEKSKDLEVVRVYLGNLSTGETFRAIARHLGHILNFSPLELKRREIKADYAGKKLDEIVEREKIDLLQAETTLSAHIWLRSKRLRPCIFDMHGLSYEQLVEQGVIKGKRVDAYWKNLQEEVIKGCGHIFAVSSPMVDYLSAYKSRDKITIVPSGGEILPYQAQFATPLKLIYAGIFEYWERVEDYAAMSSYPVDAEFYLMGDGRLKEQILNNRYRLQYLGYFKREEALRRMAEFQVGVAPSSTDITRRVASPIKVFDYMSVGLPVLTPDVGDWSTIVRQHNCGIVVKKNEPDSFVEALSEFNEESWRVMSDNGRRLIREEYNWETLIRKQAFPVYKQFS